MSNVRLALDDPAEQKSPSSPALIGPKSAQAPPTNDQPAQVNISSFARVISTFWRDPIQMFGVTCFPC